MTDQPESNIDSRDPTTDVASERPGIDWAEARRLFEDEGRSYREIAAALGGAHQTVHVHATEGGWVRKDAAVAARDQQRKAQIADAAAAQKIKWEQRRADEADAAGITAARARQAIVQSIEEKDWHMIRSTSIAYGILIDKAQLLTGGATARIDDVPLDERVSRVNETRSRLRAVREQTA